MAPRDFLTYRNYSKDEDSGEYTIIVRSIVHKDCPLNPNYVRAEIHLGGYFISPSDGKEDCCDMIYLTQTDMNGYVPRYFSIKFILIFQVGL